MSIRFKNVSHIYSPRTPFEFRALHDINLNIHQGEYVAIVGHTGSGKSTLIQHINGLLRPTSGELQVGPVTIKGDKKNKELVPLRKKVGLVFQFPEVQLFEETVKKDIEFGPKNFGVSPQKREELSSKLIEVVGLTQDHLEMSPFELSGGQKRRVAIAGILAMEPEVLIIDEPTAGLDPQGRREILDLIKKLHDDGKTIILVTHNMDDVLEFASRVIVMDKGQVVKVEKPIELFQDEKLVETAHIGLPMITSLIHKLNTKGYDISPKITDADELVRQIVLQKEKMKFTKVGK